MAEFTNQATLSYGSYTARSDVTVGELRDALELTEEPLMEQYRVSAVRENDQLTCTFIIQNRGNREATAGYNASVRDEWNPPLKNLTATLGGAPFTAFAYTGNVFTTTPGAITGTV